MNVFELGEALCAAKTASVLRELRLYEANASFEPRAAPTVRALLAHAKELGLLKENSQPSAKLGQPVRYAELLVEHANTVAEDPVGFQWLVRGLDHLQPVISGAVLAEEALFPRNDFSLAARLYAESAVFSFFSRFAVARTVELAPGRVFELGAGTGTTARAIRERLPRCEYLFTDLSPLLAREGRVLDMDSPDWNVGEHDLALALNVVHLSADPRAVLQRLHASLRPGGTLLLGELSPPHEGKPFPLMDFTFGLLPSFRAKAEAPLQSASTWQRLLRDVGFEALEFHPLARSQSVHFGGVHVARRP